ncbi:DUF3488 and transglutaminase-like domain-containing protein [Streptosporangium sp. DT93]|uniref:DUF3488 and transglutaminase-like domain-containing protein n=1 Tax=Streptosporangium sp. DT93 TaxID=3393428 RepID=UPI003CF12D7F
MNRPSISAVGTATLLGMAPMVAFAGAFGVTPVEALGNPGYVAPVAGAALVTSAVCMLAALTTRLAPVTRLTAAAAALAAYLTLMVPSDIFSAPRLLLISLPPLDPAGPELAFVAMICGLATLGAVEPALRDTPAVWRLPAPLLATAAGLAVAAPTGAPAWIAPVVACAALLALQRRDANATLRAGRQTPLWVKVLSGGALPAIVVAGTVASLLGAGLPERYGQPRPMDARELIDQPVQPRQVVSPLSQFPAMRNGRLPLSLRVTSENRPLRLRFATLTDFDGSYWTSRATYWRAGTRLPPEPQDGGRTFIEQVRVDEPGPLNWVVASGRPTEISVNGLGVDVASGDVVFPKDRPVPKEYTVHSLVADHQPATLAAEATGTPARREPRWPDLARRAVTIINGAQGYEALHRLSDHFARSGGFTLNTTLQAPGGHGIFQINQLLKEQRGTAEQYASAFAVMARELGYDVRVVVGFRSAKAGSGGRYQLTGRDADAWAEVRFAESGWVPFHPAPRHQHPEKSEAAATGQEEDSAPPADADDQSAKPAPAADAGKPSLPSGTPWLALALALAVAAGAAPSAAKAILRARRRRAADPGSRIAGAWRDVLDSYAGAGLVFGPATTSGEVSARALAHHPLVADSTRELATLVDNVFYSPGQVYAPDGDRSWALADAVRTGLRKGMSPGRRLRAWGPFPISRTFRRS